MRTIHTLPTVVLDMFLPTRQYQCHPYIISSTLYIFYHVQLSFCTLSTQMHIVHVICMWSAHVHIICLSSLTLLVYPIIHNLVSAHCLHIRHVHIIHIIYLLLPLQVDSSPRNSKTQKVKETRLISQKVK